MIRSFSPHPNHSSPQQSWGVFRHTLIKVKKGNQNMSFFGFGVNRVGEASASLCQREETMFSPLEKACLPVGRGEGGGFYSDCFEFLGV